MSNAIRLTVGVLGDADVTYDFGNREIVREEKFDGEHVFYLAL